MKITLKKPVLRIVRGKTQYPLRAIDIDEYLIGGGSSCQLQLSADGVPMIFAIIKPDADAHCIEAMFPYPELIVNGAVTRRSRLQPGDEFSIGNYRFEYLIAEVEHELRTTDGESAPAKAPKLEDSVFPNRVTKTETKTLSAAQLVEKLEQELNLLDDLGHYDDIIDEYYSDELPGSERRIA
ncbi:FHA domain-containing protein [Rubinisphaera sp.]|uniref:FHA domain-containing protein n=1 Tax=Rubinisphaera sp. TaxID=2024857 RepID=UPI0025D93E24|nr:FHA domain-containing protein [Rubinisphaera sp.]